MLHVLPGVEIQSSGAMRLAEDWNLMPLNPTTGAVKPRLGGQAMTLTLRAVGNLDLSYSLSDGFAAPSSVTGANAKTITADRLAQTGPASSYRIVAGADLSSPDPLATLAGSSGSVTLGRAAASKTAVPPSVFIRTTTGSISVAAAADIVQASSQTRLYTTGEPVAASADPGFDRIRFGSGQLLRNGNVNVGPFFTGAGDLSLRAGRDLIGSPSTTYSAAGAVQQVQFVTDWWFRQADPTVAGTPVVLWSRYDLFGQGFASFGGGSISAIAGKDIINLDLATPTNGYAIGEVAGATTLPSQQRWYRGGTLAVSAGNDIVSGLFDAGGSRASLVARGAITGSSDTGFGRALPQTQWLYLDTDWRVSATGGLKIGSPIDPALMTGSVQGTERGPRLDGVFGVAGGSSASVVSVAGSVDLTGSRPILGAGDRRMVSNGGLIIPDEFNAAAANGSLTVGTLYQDPLGDASLNLLARDAVQVGYLGLSASSAAGTLPTVASSSSLADRFTPSLGEWSRSLQGADLSTLRDDRIVSATASIEFGGGFSARPLQVTADQDLRLSSEWQLQHQASSGDAVGAGELSLLQAGRDVRLSSSASIRVAGPGDLMIAAGRDVDFGRGNGMVTLGNQENPLTLGRGGANVSIAAGVSLPGPGQALAATADFALIGAGLGYRPSEVLAELRSLKDKGRFRTDQERADAAMAATLAQLDFDKLTPAEQARAVESDQAALRDAVREFVGAAAYDTSAAAYADRVLAQATRLGETAAKLAGETAARRRTAPVTPGGQLTSLPDSATARNLPATGDYLVIPGSNNDATAVLPSLRQSAIDHAAGPALADYLATRLDAASRAQLDAAVSPYASRLAAYVQARTGRSGLQTADAAADFNQLSPAEQLLFDQTVLFDELRGAGRETLAIGGARLAYLRGYDAMAAMFKDAAGMDAGITLSSSQVKTQQGGNIALLAPSGSINVGDLGSAGSTKSASDIGVVTIAGGAVQAAVRDEIAVNQSRVFTLARGDLMLWAALGNIDAGRGAKTVTGSPPPLYTINNKGEFVVDTSGSFSGSGIAVLDAASTLDLYAPMGEINAGDAGILAKGNANFGAVRLVGADNLSIGGVAQGAPPPAPSAPVTVGPSSAGNASNAGIAKATDTDDDDEKKRKRRPKRRLWLDFLGFGSGEG
jgi:hypothetical protein